MTPHVKQQMKSMYYEYHRILERYVPKDKLADAVYRVSARSLQYESEAVDRVLQAFMRQTGREQKEAHSGRPQRV